MCGNKSYIYSLRIQQEIKKQLYVSVCFGLWSTIENIDFFKTILIYLYEITQSNPKKLVSALSFINKTHKNNNEESSLII